MLRFADEAGSFVEVDPLDRVGAVAVVEADATLEDVGVVGVVLDGRLGPRDGEHVAQFREEELVVGAFGPGGFTPAVDEGLGGVFHAEFRGDEGLIGLR
ncbi:MAG: hypothetical protein WD851_17995 [Pirellulales bacterium]